MDFLKLFASFRQLRYPEVFRIEPNHWTFRLVATPRTTSTVTEIPESFSRELGTGLFRMERSAAKVKVPPGAAQRDVGQVRRVLEQMRSLLAAYEIEVIDPTGQPIRPGRKDLEILGDPEPSPQVTEPTVSFCERPMVMSRGRLILIAKVTVSI